MNVTEVLIKARGRLEDPKMWTTGRLAEEPLDPNTAMCVGGTINWAVAGHAHPSMWGLSEEEHMAAHNLANRANLTICRAVGRRSVTSWNDNWNTSHADILKGLDEAIKLSRD